MKNIILFLSILTSGHAQSAIYGEDERQLAYETPIYQEYSRSVLSQIRDGSLILEQEDYFLKTKSLNEHVGNLCEDTPFKDVPTFSRCSAFLISDDLMVTAGHCINNHDECLKAVWVFSDEIDPRDPKPRILKQDIVKCDKIVSRIKNPISKNDYALIKLTSKVSHRPHLKFRTSGRIENEDRLLVLGHPTGLPLTISDNNKILENSSDFLFKINSDTFGGNSGSPVINLRTGLVEGILTDGDLDYILDSERKCKTTFKCRDNQCRGENVVRITNIPELVPNMTPVEPIFDPRLPRL
ncbi:MAG: hypothetical protein OHK0056_25960 [Bacteriovoracaceae bacterium]